MNFGNRLVVRACVVALGLVLGGCDPSGSSPQDEMKEPHYVLGQSRVNAMDFEGAIDAFEQSLEVNPHSAQAHFQLAMLYEQKESNPAAAIYHYQQYLKYNPKAGNADLITQRIEACKQQLAANVMLLPSSSSAQQQIQQLIDTNRRLQEQINWWQTQYTNLLNAARLNPPVSVSQNNPAPQPNPPPARRVAAESGGESSRAAAARSRTHVVTRGETAMAIARRYGVKLSALQAANPGVNLGKIRVGQVLNLPPS
jgi:tetratricopeptide (TPR) repeat protein